MRVSVVQMNPGADKADNIAQARRLLGRGDRRRPARHRQPAGGLDLPRRRPRRQVRAGRRCCRAKGSNEPGGPAYEFLREIARGARDPRAWRLDASNSGGEKLFNTTVVFDPDGSEIARYRKIHLFDIVTPDGTGYRESSTYGAGDEVVTYRGRRRHGRLRHLLRPALPRPVLDAARAGAELIFLPSAFTLQTGKDHWEVLIRARAIETQCWFAAPATWGKHLDGKGEARFTYGHSLVCDPWGQVVAQVSDGIGWATARIDPTLTARVRRDMPVLEHRKLA